MHFQNSQFHVFVRRSQYRLDKLSPKYIQKKKKTSLRNPVLKKHCISCSYVCYLYVKIIRPDSAYR